MPIPRSNDQSAEARVHMVKKERSDYMQEERGEVKNQTNGKDKGKAKGGNHSKRGGQGTQHNHNHNHNQQRKQQMQHHNHNHTHHPNGQQSGSGSSQSRRGRGDGGAQVHAGQKRSVTESVTNGHDRHAVKRHKGERRPSSSSGSDPKPNPDSGAMRRHPDFWLFDGSVIIQIEKTEFRLHQSTLQKYSEYFAAAFREKAGGHECGGRAYVDDERSPNSHHLPVYRVTETTAEDFAALLTVIEGIEYAEKAPRMPVLAGILRAARALSFDVQYKWAKRIFGLFWPATLDSITDHKISYAAAALAFALARTCGLRDVQKRASYEILRMPTFGQKVVAATAAPVEAEKDSRADTGLDELSRADLLRLLHAREQLGLEWAEAAGEAPTDFVCPRGRQTQISTPKRGDNSSTSSGNNDGRRCCASANVDRMHARWAKLVHTTGLYADGMVDPLMGLKKLMEIRWMDEEGFCKECVAARTNAWDKLRRKLWDDLDVWLQLSADENA